MNGCLIVLIALVGVAILDFALVAVIVKGVCWAFGFAFSWKIAFGVWLIVLLLHAVFFRERE